MHNILTIFRKEMLDTLRDRRTLLTMVVMPLVLIPLLISLMAQVSTSQAESEREKTLRVAVETHGEGADLMERLERRKDLQLLSGIDPSEFRDLVRADSLDLAMIIEPGFDALIEAGNTGKLQVYYNSTNEIPFDRLSKTLEEYDESVLRERLDLLGASPATITPIDVEQVDIYTSRESLGKMIGGFLPYIFVLFCLVGAMYPSIDLFTGEKERGTLETILTVPVGRLQILTGKMLTVVLSGVLSGLLSIVGMYAALQFIPDIPEAFRTIILQILNPTSIALIVLMIVPLTIFFAGILIPASIYARSFKEAQTLIQPMVIVAIIPLAIVASVPNIKFSFATALIPIVNVGLASKEIIAGTVDYGLLGLTFVSLVLLATIGILLCVRWFGQEGNILRV